MNNIIKKNILIVEDDENKRNQLLDFISKNALDVNIAVAKSYQSGLRAIVAGNIDLVLLDMSLPTFDYTVDQAGGRMQAYGGRELLRQMDRRNIDYPVIIVTQFDKFGEGVSTLTRDQLASQLQSAHSKTYYGMVYYNAARDSWKESLRIFLCALKFIKED